MAVDFLVIPAGSNASGAYFNARSDLPITLVIPMSCNPSELRIQCAVSSGASQSGDSFGEVQIQQQPGNIFGTRSPSAPSARFRHARRSWGRLARCRRRSSGSSLKLRDDHEHDTVATARYN